MLLGKCTEKKSTSVPSYKKEEFVTFGVARSKGIVHKTLYSGIICWHWLSSILFLPTYCNLLHNPTYFTIWLILFPLSFAACRQPQLRPTTVQAVYMSIAIISFVSISLKPVNNVRIHIFIPGSRSFTPSASDVPCSKSCWSRDDRRCVQTTRQLRVTDTCTSNVP